MPGLPGLAAGQPMTPVDALDLDHLPEYLIVLGGVEVARGIGHHGQANAWAKPC